MTVVQSIPCTVVNRDSHYPFAPYTSLSSPKALGFREFRGLSLGYSKMTPNLDRYPRVYVPQLTGV